MKTKEVDCRYRAKWNHDLDMHIDNKTWRRVFYLLFNVEQDNNLIWFQYKLIHRILCTNSQLYKMSIEKSDKCRLCQSDPETFMHLFVKCRHVVELWKHLENWIYSNLGKLIYFKYYIFKSATNKSVPNIVGLKNNLKRKYEEQFYIQPECE